MAEQVASIRHTLSASNWPPFCLMIQSDITKYLADLLPEASECHPESLFPCFDIPKPS